MIIRDVGIGRFSLSELKKILEFALPIYVTGILWYIFDLGILIYVDYADAISGSETIALYRYGALTVVNLILLAGNVFNMVYSPVIYKHFERKDYDYMKKISIQVSKIFVSLLFPLSLALFSLSPYLIIFFTKAEYLPSLVVVPILLVSILFQYIGRISNYGHTLYFKNYWNLIVGAITFILAALAAYYIIPINGLIGIGIAYLVRRVFYFLGLLIVSQKYFKVDYPKLTLAFITAVMIFSAGTGAILYYFAFGFLGTNLNILVSFGISTLLFCILVITLRLISRDDVKFITDLIRNYFKGVKATQQKS